MADNEPREPNLSDEWEDYHRIVRQLGAEIDTLRGHREELKAQIAQDASRLAAAERERDTLKARVRELERLLGMHPSIAIGGTS